MFFARKVTLPTPLKKNSNIIPYFLISIYQICSRRCVMDQTKIISCEHRVYILKGFKFYIKNILYYSFKLKYLNKKVFYLTLEKLNFFLVDIEYIYEKVSNSTLKKIILKLIEDEIVKEK